MCIECAPHIYLEHSAVRPGHSRTPGGRLTCPLSRVLDRVRTSVQRRRRRAPVRDALATRDEFGAPGDNIGELLDGPYTDPEIATDAHQRVAAHRAMARPLGVLPRAVREVRCRTAARSASPTASWACASSSADSRSSSTLPHHAVKTGPVGTSAGPTGPGGSRPPGAGMVDAAARASSRRRLVGGAGWPARTPAPVRPQLVVCRPRSRCSPGPPASPGRRPVVLRGVVDRVGSDA